MSPYQYVFQSERKTGAMVKEKMVMSLMRMFKAGPEVSLKGSPTVSPTTHALCVFRLLAAVHLFVFDVLLGVVPSATGVGHHHGEHETGRDGTGEETAEALGADEQTDGDRRHDGEDARNQHFVDGRLRAHGDARHVIAHDAFLAFEETRNVAELALDFDDDRASSLTHGEHGEGSEEERQHGAEDDTGEHVRVGERQGGGQRTVARPTVAYGTSLTNAFIKESAVKTAEPMAKPLPVAAVVLPSASSLSVRSRTSSGTSGDISAMPPALSATGPYASVARVTPRVDNIPTAAMEIPYKPSCQRLRRYSTR